MKDIFCNEEEGGVIISVYVQPRSSRVSLQGIREGDLKITLTAPPLEEKANKQLIALLSELLDVGKTNIQIIRGKKSRKKGVKINGLTCKDLLNKLSPHLFG